MSENAVQWRCGTHCTCNSSFQITEMNIWQSLLNNLLTHFKYKSVSQKCVLKWILNKANAQRKEVRRSWKWRKENSSRRSVPACEVSAAVAFNKAAVFKNTPNPTVKKKAVAVTKMFRIKDPLGYQWCPILSGVIPSFSMDNFHRFTYIFMQNYLIFHCIPLILLSNISQIADFVKEKCFPSIRATMFSVLL